PGTRTCVRGRVVDEQAAPVAGVTLGGKRFGSTESANDGSFCTRAAPYQSTAVMVAAADTKTGFTRVAPGASGPSCELSPGDCTDAGDIVVSAGSGCPGGVKGTWRVVEDPAENYFVEHEGAVTMNLFFYGAFSPT